MDQYIELAESPLRPGVSPVRIRYREFGTGPGLPLLILHGGWGCNVYPFDRQIAALAAARRILVPDRSGYGGSGRLLTQESDFHQCAAAESFALMDALALDRAILWGHSDGAVIALLMGLQAPERIGGLIVEATHVFRRKPASRAFFELMRDNPDRLGERVTSVLAREHGDDWRHLISINGDAWLRLAGDGGDLYDGRLSALRVPVMVVHGARDPRTEPGELDALRDALAGGDVPVRRTHRSASTKIERIADLPVGADLRVGPQFVILPDAGHSPHSERATADEVTRAALQFLSALASNKTVPTARS